jgi:hypothetical protein
LKNNYVPYLGTAIKNGEPCWKMTLVVTESLVVCLYISRIWAEVGWIERYMFECVFDNQPYVVLRGVSQEEANAMGEGHITMAQAQLVFGENIEHYADEMTERWGALKFLMVPMATNGATVYKKEA